MNAEHPARFAVVVNDDLTQLGVLSGLVRKAGLEPRSFTAAEPALAEMAARAKAVGGVPGALPALVVTDLYMPGIDGWRFCRLLRSHEYAALNQVPILVVSATFAGEETGRIAADLGANAFLPSPVDGRRFVEQVREILSGRQKRTPLRVLVVEDSRALADMLRDAFVANGYHADTAPTVQAAADSFNEAPYDIAVIDYHLPDGLGDDLLDMFRAGRPECVCVMMTTDTGPELALDWMKRGAAAYLKKPFDPSYLIELCARASRERALLRTQDLLDLRTKELMASEERMRTLFDYSPISIWEEDFSAVKARFDTLRAEGVSDWRRYFTEHPETVTECVGLAKVIDVNQTSVDFFQAGSRENLSRTIADYFTEGSLQVFTEEMVALAEGRTSFESEMPIRNLQGEAQVLWLTLRVMPGKAETLGRVLVSFIDITERKRAEAGLRELTLKVGSQEVFHVLVETASEGFWLLDKQFATAYVNPAIEEMLGYLKEEMIGRSWYDFGDPEWAVRARELERRRRAGVKEPHEFLFVRKDGGRVLARVSTTPLYDKDGNFDGALGVLSDITRQREADDALKIKDMLNAIAQSAGIGMSILNPDFTIAWYNDLYVRWFGPLDKTRGRNCFDVFEGRDEACDDCPVRETFQTGAIATAERDGITTSAGVGRIVAITTSPIRDAVGNVIQVVEIVQDITERKRSESVLAHSHSLMRYIIEHNRSAIAVHDKDLRYAYVSQRYLEDYNVKEKDIIGKHHYEVFPDLPQKWRDVHQKALAGEVSSAEDDPYVREDGTVDWTRWECRPWYEADGSIGGIIIYTEVTTERKLAEAGRAKLEAQLQQAQKMETVGRLAGGVAHDFNNMLGVILGHAELAIDGLDPSHPLQADLKEIIDATKRSADLTRQLLAFARKQAISPRVLDINDTVEGILKILRRMIGEDIDVAWSPGENVWPVKLDPSQIDQILANLCVNARDAISGIGKITIKTGNTAFDEAHCAVHVGHVPGEHVMLAVSDDGCGMDKETVSRIFEPFFTTKEMGRGTGLGLATVYGIVLQNRGFIDVFSEPGLGTTFRIYLPRHHGEAGLAREEVSEGPPVRGCETVLLVEDEPAVLDVATTMLEMHGYTVLASSTPGAAIRLAKSHPGEIHLLVTDLVMPEMNGKDLARNLLSLRPNIKQLFVSGFTTSFVAPNDVLDEGVNFIQKPFSIKDMAAKVREALDRP